MYRNFLHPRYWLLWCALAFLWLLVQLPYPTLLKLGRMLGLLMLPIARDRKAIVARNIALCLPYLTPVAQAALVRKNFESTGIAFFEMAMGWWWPAERLHALTKIEGLEYLQEAHTQGSGVILLAAHFTTLEIGGALLGQRQTIDGMYRAHKNPLFDCIQRNGRERHNSDAQAIERDDVRTMIKMLRKGRIVWYAPDQDYGRKHSIFVPLFGVPAATVTATSKFARLSKALVIPFTQERLGDGSGYQLTIHPPLKNFPGTSEEADCLRINQWLESVIQANPEQYLWAHRRFKTRPAGTASVY